MVFISQHYVRGLHSKNRCFLCLKKKKGTYCDPGSLERQLPCNALHCLSLVWQNFSKWNCELNASYLQPLHSHLLLVSGPSSPLCYFLLLFNPIKTYSQERAWESCKWWVKPRCGLLWGHFHCSRRQSHKAGRHSAAMGPWGGGMCSLHLHSVPGIASGTGKTTVNRRDPVPALKRHIVYSGGRKGWGSGGDSHSSQCPWDHTEWSL